MNDSVHFTIIQKYLKERDIMKKNFYIFMITLISFVLLCGCTQKNPQDEIIKLNIPKKGAVKFEFLPTECPVTNGGETTDLNLIDTIISQLNGYEYQVSAVEGTPSGMEGKRVRITYENGNTLEFVDRGGLLHRSDGTWLEPIMTGGVPELRKYLVERLDFRLYPDQTRLHIPEEGVESISYLLYYSDLKIEAIKDPQELEYLIHELNRNGYFIRSTYTNEYPAPPRGVFVIKYADGSEIKYTDADRFLMRPDGVWLEQYSRGGIDISDILDRYFGLGYDIVYGQNG